MEQKSSRFGTLTPRMKAYREALLSARPQVCAERAMLTTESYRLHADKPVVLRRAYMLQNILEKMTIYIEPETLLGGAQRGVEDGAAHGFGLQGSRRFQVGERAFSFGGQRNPLARRQP